MRTGSLEISELVIVLYSPLQTPLPTTITTISYSKSINIKTNAATLTHIQPIYSTNSLYISYKKLLIIILFTFYERE